MARDSYDPFKDEEPVHKPRRKSPRQIDWKKGARLLADGASAAETAAALGIDEDHLWRHLKASLRFRFHLRQAVDRRRMLSDLQLGAAGSAALLRRSQQGEGLDGETLRWLTGRHAPHGGEDDEAGRDTGRAVEDLAETGRRPPNEAQRKRLEAEKRSLQARMAQVQARYRTKLDAMAAAREEAGPAEPPAPPAKVPEAAAKPPEAAGKAPELPANPPEAATSANEAPRMPANTSEAPRMPANAGEAPRTAVNAGEGRRSATNAGETGAGDTDTGEDAAWARHPHVARARLYGSIVDLPGPEIPAAGGRP